VCPSQYTYYSKTLSKHTGDGEVKFDSRVDSLSFSVEDVYVAYYSRQPWYMPDPGYVADKSKLTQDERTLLKR